MDGCKSGFKNCLSNKKSDRGCTNSINDYKKIFITKKFKMNDLSIISVTEQYYYGANSV
jgi:hypothetical protein